MGSKSLEYLNDEEELEFFKSQGFKDNFRETVDKETWGKGLPKIYGENNTVECRYDIVAHYKNGEKIVLGYNKDGMSISLPNDFNNTTVYEGYWSESFTQKAIANTLDDLIRQMNENKELFLCNHKLYISRL